MRSLRGLLPAVLVVLAGGCALVAGLNDRDPADASDGGSGDGTIDGDSDVSGDGGTSDGEPPSDGASLDAAHADAAGDAADAQTVEGVACGASLCDAAQGCCGEAGVCDTLTSCVSNHASCDGPEDCPGTNCCSTGPGSLCNSGGCGAYVCHTDGECSTVSPSEPHCCPATSNPYRVCSASVCP